MKGLGENPQIQEQYVFHLTFKTTHRKVGIMEKKALYQKTGQKMGSDH
jgi:sirohydrochlorin cobaltochelatase